MAPQITQNLSRVLPFENIQKRNTSQLKYSKSPLQNHSKSSQALWGHSGSGRFGVTRGRRHFTRNHFTQNHPTQSHPTRNHLTQNHPTQSHPTQNHPTQNQPTQSHLTRVAAVLRVPPFCQLSSKPIHSESNMLVHGYARVHSSIYIYIHTNVFY